MYKVANNLWQKKEGISDPFHSSDLFLAAKRNWTTTHQLTGAMRRGANFVPNAPAISFPVR